jgi:hypothetical protein
LKTQRIILVGFVLNGAASQLRSERYYYCSLRTAWIQIAEPKESHDKKRTAQLKSFHPDLTRGDVESYPKFIHSRARWIITSDKSAPVKCSIVPTAYGLRPAYHAENGLVDDGE